MGWVNTRPLVCLASSTRSADAREARFYGELIIIINVDMLFVCQDENEPEDESFCLFLTKPVMNEPGFKYYDTFKD